MIMPLHSLCYDYFFPTDSGASWKKLQRNSKWIIPEDDDSEDEYRPAAEDNEQSDEDLANQAENFSDDNEPATKKAPKTHEIRTAGYFKSSNSGGEDAVGDEMVEEMKSWPPALKMATNSPLLISAAGGLFSYLRMLKLDAELISLGNFHSYDPVRQSSSLILDGQTLANLEVLENNFDGGTEGTLFRLLDHCITPLIFVRKLYSNSYIDMLKSKRKTDSTKEEIPSLIRYTEFTVEIDKSEFKPYNYQMLRGRLACWLKGYFIPPYYQELLNSLAQLFTIR
ncbi:uncharacterized protein VTP21DRAFT_7504 [Calcarisporiella thermophila]|uniref:uncharacterized protein n=1 Tax=Calcarisporiella thermophila TaxID=911321 RepID=UPI00374305B6